MSTTPNTAAPIALRGATAVGQPGAFEEHFGAPHSLPIGKPFQRFSGVGRSTQYALVERGELESFLVGSRRYVLVASWVAYCKRQQAKDAANRAKGGPLLMRGEVR